MSTLNEDLDSALSKAKVSTGLVTVLSVFSIVAIGFWLNYAHGKFTEITPEFAADYGVAQLVTTLPGIEPKIKQQLVDAAPGVMELAGKELNAMPDRFATMMLNHTREEMDKLVPQMQTEIVKSMKTALDKAKAERGTGVDDASHTKALIITLTDAYGDESLKLLDEVKTKYADRGTDILAHLEHLANNKGLTKRESLERQALVTFLTLASRAKSASAGM